jgi:hypothetical protein
MTHQNHFTAKIVIPTQVETNERHRKPFYSNLIHTNPIICCHGRFPKSEQGVISSDILGNLRYSMKLLKDLRRCMASTSHTLTRSYIINLVIRDVALDRSCNSDH